jgi:hypothetical protein
MLLGIIKSGSATIGFDSIRTESVRKRETVLAIIIVLDYPLVVRVILLIFIHFILSNPSVTPARLAVILCI